MERLDHLAKATDKLARWRVFWSSGLILGLFALVFFGSAAPFAVGRVAHLCGQSPPDVRVFSSAAEVHGFLMECGPTGRAAYRNMQIADLVYPAIVGIALSSALALLIKHTPRLARRWMAVAALPVLGGLFDYLENLTAWVALARYPSVSWTDGILGIASAAKQAAFWTGGTLLLVFGLAALARASIGLTRRPSNGEPIQRQHKPGQSPTRG